MGVSGRVTMSLAMDRHQEGFKWYSRFKSLEPSVASTDENASKA